MSECVLIYFLSFAQLEKKNEQAEKKDCYHGSAEAFFFYWMIRHCGFYVVYIVACIKESLGLLLLFFSLQDSYLWILLSLSRPVFKFF